MTAFAIIITPFLLALAAITIVDLFRHHYTGSAIAAWIAFIIFVPVIGSLAYWLTRRPPDDAATAEHVYRAEADMRGERQRAPIDHSGL